MMFLSFKILVFVRIYHRIYPNVMVISMGLRSRWSSGYGQLLLGGLDGLLPVGWKGRDVGSWGKLQW